MSNSLNLTNIKNLLAAAYLSGVHDAFEKSKGLDTYSLQKNIEDASQFREMLISELKNNNVAKPESILITAKAKGKELFCEKYPDEAKCKTTPPTNNSPKETGFLSAITSLFSSTKNVPPPSNVNLSRVNTSLPNTNTPRVNNSLPSTNMPRVNNSLPSMNTPRINIPTLPNSSTTNITIPPPSVANVVSMPPSVATNITIPPPSVATNVTAVPPSVATPNASALNPMIQSPVTVGGKRKSK